MKPEIRIYGEIKGIGNEAYNRLQDMLSFDTVNYSDNVLIFEHEGFYYDDLDHLVDVLCDALDDSGRGWVDRIDNSNWTVDRYTLAPEGKQLEHIRVDDYLDRYRYYE